LTAGRDCRTTSRPSLHDGRHTAATLLLDENVHPRSVVELLGHSQMRTTMDVHRHVMQGRAREAADRMDSALLTASCGDGTVTGRSSESSPNGPVPGDPHGPFSTASCILQVMGRSVACSPSFHQVT
jgi:integrase-like protein